MTCKGCPGTQKQVGEEQAEFARIYAAQQTERLTARVNACLRCGSWRGHWNCAKFATSTAYRKAIRSGKCPEGSW